MEHEIVQQIIFISEFFFTDYTRLIDSGRALYEFSFDSGGIDAYKDFVYLTIEFRAPNSQSLGSFRFRKYTR